MEQPEFDVKFNVDELQEWLLANGFSEDTAKSCRDEDMDGETIHSLAHSGSIEQFKCCGFIKVKDQLKLKKLVLLIGDSVPSSSSKLVANNVTVNISSNGKLSLAEMKKLTPEERRVYLMKRNKVADYADQAWPDEVPRFKNNEANQKKLEKLVARITPECSLPFFPSKGIKQHIIDHFHEKRRYRDNLKRGHSFTAESGSVQKKRKEGPSSSTGTPIVQGPESSIQLSPTKTSEGSNTTNSDAAIATSLNIDDKDKETDLDLDDTYKPAENNSSEELDSTSASDDERDPEEIPLKAAEIIVTCGFDQLFIKSIGKQQISAAAKSLLTKQQNKMLKGAEKSKYLPLLAKAFIDNHIVKVKKGADLRKISRCDVKKIKTF